MRRWPPSPLSIPLALQALWCRDQVPLQEPLPLSVYGGSCFVFIEDLLGLQPAQDSCTWGSQALSLALCLLLSEGGCSDSQTAAQGGGWPMEGAAGTQAHRAAGSLQSHLFPSQLEKRLPMPGPPVGGLKLIMEEQFSSSLRQGGPVHRSLLNVSSSRALGVGPRVRGGQLLAGQSLP